MGRRITKNCEYCGQEYTVYESIPGRSKFCSDKCFRASRNIQVPYQCDCCGEWFMAPNIKVRKIKSGKQHSLCCSKKCTLKLKAPSFEFIRSFLDKQGYDLLSTEYVNAKKHLKFICRKHPEIGVQNMNWSNLKSGCGCKCCSMSEGESRIYRWLSKNNIEFEPQKTFDDLIGTRGGLLSYDFFIPSYNLLIEYQGQYHDGNLLDESFQDAESLERQRTHDKIKKDYTTQNDYNFLEIWYFDKNNIEHILKTYFDTTNMSYESSETAGS